MLFFYSIMSLLVGKNRHFPPVWGTCYITFSPTSYALNLRTRQIALSLSIQEGSSKKSNLNRESAIKSAWTLSVLNIGGEHMHESGARFSSAHQHSVQYHTSLLLSFRRKTVDYRLALYKCQLLWFKIIEITAGV